MFRWPFGESNPADPAWEARRRVVAEESARQGGLAAQSARFVSVDIETSGLDATKDRLLAIGAVVIEAGQIVPSQSFEAVIRQDVVSSDENILVHRLGGDRQRGGTPPAEALSAFAAFVGGSPMVGYHAWFDETVLKRSFKQFKGASMSMRWLDLADLAPASHPRLLTRSKKPLSPHGPLDAWLEAAGIPVFERHNAVADAYATAQLFLWCFPSFAANGVKTVDDLERLQRAWRWASNR